MAEKKLLIIDDDPGTCESLADIFQEKGYCVSKAHTGHEALDIVGQEKFNVALIDIRLPDLKGMELLDTFKKDYPETACMIITGYGSLQDAIKALEDGAKGFFTKPLVLEDVLLRVEDVLEKQSLERKLKESNKQLKASLKQKELLLKEIHHRVKNNLQIIISLLRLQSRHFKDKKSQDLLEIIQNRIKSIALIHEKLYQSENLSSFDFGNYIRGLTAYLLQIAGKRASDIQIKIDSEETFLDINKAIPCGLIINELVFNALKHAFPEGRKGEIHIEMYPCKKGRHTLIISDNGTGFPEDIDFKNTDSLGLQLVNDLVRQIEGALELDREGGTTFKIEF